MAATIRLTVITGPHKNKRFCFRGRTQCLIGRAPDCFVQLVGEDRDQLISRHHCELDVEPPCARLSDLDSRNGTYLNGRSLNQLEKSLLDVLSAEKDGGVPLSDGDIITVGGTSLRTDIVDCPPAHINPADVWKAEETAKKDCGVDC